MSNTSTAMERTISALRAGKLVMLLDDAQSEPNVFLVGAALSITPEDICLMVNEGRGVVCAALSESRIHQLGLAPATFRQYQSSIEFAASVDARQGISTGISASDRARTLRTLAKTSNPKQDLVTPGHIFPMKSKDGGVLIKNAVAEAVVDLLKIAELSEVGALCQCLAENGSLIAKTDALDIAERHGLVVLTIADIIRKRLASEQLIEKVAEAHLPTAQAGEFRVIVFRSTTDSAEHLVLVKGDIEAVSPTLVRVQVENRLGDLLAPSAFNSRALLNGALKEIDRNGSGVLVYIRHSHHGSLSEQVRSYGAIASADSLTRQLREYGVGAQILKALGVNKIRLLSRSGHVPDGLGAFDIDIVETLSFSAHPQQPIASLEQLIKLSHKPRAVGE